MHLILDHSISLEKLHQYNLTADRINSDEAILVEECIAGNRLAHKVLYEKHYDRLLGICFRYIPNKADAEDVLHDSFIIIFKKLHTFRKDSKLNTWVTRIVINNALQHLRKTKKSPLRFLDEMDIEIENDIQEEEIQQLSSNALFQLIKKLPTGFRTVLCLYSIDGYSHKEISKLLNISEIGSRSQLTRARKQLRKLIQGKEGSHER